jgi:hypothetical protein
MSTPENIKNKAYSAARQLVRNRLAESAGAAYEKLGPTEKMNIDRAVETKQTHIKKIALKLIPQIASAEKKRKDSFTAGSPLSNNGSPEKGDVHEALNKKFSSTIKSTEKKPEAKKGKSPHIIVHNTFGEEVALDSPVYKALLNKAEKANVDITIIGEIYNRGMSVWYEDTNVSQQQYAFARVNSFINKGKTYFNEDYDLLPENFGDDYHVLHINGKPATRYQFAGDAKKDMDLLAKKHPKAELKLKKVSTTIHEASKKMKGEDPCWKDYKMVGTKKKGGKEVPNCVPEETEIEEATYKGKTVPLNKPMQGDVKKSKVYVDPDGDGKAQKVNFGDKTLSIKKNIPDRKKSYCARSGGQGNLNDKTSANYWSRKAWNCEETEIEEAKAKPYVKPYFHPQTKEQLGWVSSDGYHKKYWQKFAKKSALKHAKLEESDTSKANPSNREWGTEKLTKTYKNDTPGENKKLDESFNMAFDYQGKPTLAPTAHQLMMKTQGGFAHHNDVKDVMNVTAIKEQIEKAFQATILEEDKDELAISMDSLIDMVNEAFATIENIKSANIDRDAWSQAQILKLERYIESVAAYIDNMNETVRSGETHGVIVPAHTIVSQKTGQSITIPAKSKKVKKNDVVLHPHDNPFDGK